MDAASASTTQRSVRTPSGRIAYAGKGQGPVALFVHGVLVNGYLWRHQLAHLGATCGAASPSICWPRSHRDRSGAGVSSTANATMLLQFLEALKIERSTWWATTAAAASRRSSRPSTRARPQPDADRLRHARQLAAGSVQAVPRAVGRRRPARRARNDARRQELLPLGPTRWARRTKTPRR